MVLESHLFIYNKKIIELNLSETLELTYNEIVKDHTCTMSYLWVNITFSFDMLQQNNNETLNNMHFNKIK